MQQHHQQDIKSGAQAVVGVLIAIVGALAAANPQCAVLRALSETAPLLGDVIPTVPRLGEDAWSPKLCARMSVAIEALDP